MNQTLIYMARVDKQSVLSALRGSIGKELVFKKYGDKTVVSRYPDMRRVKKTPLQKLGQGFFKDAVAYAQSIIRDPKKKAAYQKKLPKGSSVYHAAIKEFMNKSRKKGKG